MKKLIKSIISVVVLFGIVPQLLFGFTDTWTYTSTTTPITINPTQINSTDPYIRAQRYIYPQGAIMAKIDGLFDDLNYPSGNVLAQPDELYYPDLGVLASPFTLNYPPLNPGSTGQQLASKTTLNFPTGNKHLDNNGIGYFNDGLMLFDNSDNLYAPTSLAVATTSLDHVLNVDGSVFIDVNDSPDLEENTFSMGVDPSTANNDIDLTLGHGIDSSIVLNGETYIRHGSDGLGGSLHVVGDAKIQGDIIGHNSLFEVDTSGNVLANSITSDSGNFESDGSGNVFINGIVGIGTTSPGTRLSIGNTGNNTINISPTATSTFGSGLNIRTGCYAVNGTCLSSGGSGIVNPGVFGQVTYYGANGSTVSGTSTLVIGTTTGDANHIGIGATTTPYAQLAIVASTSPGIPYIDISTTSNSFTAHLLEFTSGGRLAVGCFQNPSNINYEFQVFPCAADKPTGIFKIAPGGTNYLSVENGGLVLTNGNILDDPASGNKATLAKLTVGGNTILGNTPGSSVTTGSGNVLDDGTSHASFGNANIASWDIGVTDADTITDDIGTINISTLNTTGAINNSGEYIDQNGSSGSNGSVLTSTNIGTLWSDITKLSFVNNNLGIGTDTPYASSSIQSNSSIGDAWAVATSSGKAVRGEDNSGHTWTSGPAPVISACGTGTGTVTGDDQSGTITTATAATACTMTFSKVYRKTPSCTVTDNSLVGFADISSISTSAVTFGISSALTGGNLYYSCQYHQ